MIDEEIRAALDVDPSPEFLARVRTRIAAEHAPPAWRWSWGVAAACALTAALVVATIVSRSHGARPGVKAALVPTVIAETASPPIVVPSPDIGPRPTRAVPPPTKAGIARIARSEPEILIDPGEMRTLRVLIDGVRAGRIDLSAAQNSRSPAPALLEPVADIMIAPLTIEPIAPLSGAEGVRP
jgi:hypothetical protein